jgi:hypothetical protein
VATAPFSRVQISSQLNSSSHHQLLCQFVRARSVHYLDGHFEKFQSEILAKFLRPQAVELCDVINIHEIVLQQEMSRPEVMLAISICEYIFYCGTCITSN